MTNAAIQGRVLQRRGNPLLPAGGVMPKWRRTSAIRWWLYAYLFLLVFEGAIRKWLLFRMPTLGNVFLIIRDPVALVIYFLAWRDQLWPRILLLNWFRVLAFALAILGLVQLSLHPELNRWVMVYGLRCFLLHLPLAFLMPCILDRAELLRIGRWSLYLAPGLAVLMVLQFALPASSFLNISVGGGEQIGAAMGHVRPAATFSYNNGAGSYFLLAGAFWLYSFVNPYWLSARVKWWSAAAIVLTLPVSGSRGYVLGFGVLLVFAWVGGHYSSRLWTAALRTTFALAIVLTILVQVGIFRSGLDAFQSRWQGAADGSVYQSIVVRFFDGFTVAFTNLRAIPWLGYGLGLGTNVGARLMTGDAGYMLAEGEWLRTMEEMGIAMGVMWLLYRVVITIAVSIRAWRRVGQGDSLGWLLWGASLVNFLTGIFSQPTSLGFITISLGCCLAAIGYGVSSPGGEPPLMGSREPRRGPGASQSGFSRRRFGRGPP